MSFLVAWLIFFAYEVVAMAAARFAYPHMDSDPDDQVEKVLLAGMLLFFGQLWPLAAPVALILWKPRKTPEQVQAENEQMKRRIDELERELGIGGRS